MVAAAKASVGPQLLPDLVEHVQAHLGPRLEAYRREYERALRTDDYEVFFVEAGHWDDLGEEFDLEPRFTASRSRGSRSNSSPRSSQWPASTKKTS